MTNNNQIIYLDVKTEDIPTCYKLLKKYNLVEQILKQIQQGEPK